MDAPQGRVVPPYRPPCTDRRARRWLRAFAFTATSKWAVTPQRLGKGGAGESRARELGLR